jgi:hypothetical protein
LRYRQPDTLNALLKETNCVLTRTTRENLPAFQVTLTPREKRFDYKYLDAGAYVEEEWTTKITIVVDSSTRLARDLTLIKFRRQFKPNDTERPAAIQRIHRYVFKYGVTDGVLVPTVLSCYLDSVAALSITATYRRQDGYLLFDTRQICYRSGTDKKSCLSCKYGTYKYNEDILMDVTKSGTDDKYMKKLKQAAQLSQKATDALRAGQLQSAIRQLRTLANDYRGTPQAVEAQKLLDGLPDGL